MIRLLLVALLVGTAAMAAPAAPPRKATTESPEVLAVPAVPTGELPVAPTPPVPPAPPVAPAAPELPVAPAPLSEAERELRDLIESGAESLQTLVGEGAGGADQGEAAPMLRLPGLAPGTATNAGGLLGPADPAFILALDQALRESEGGAPDPEIPTPAETEDED